MHKTPTFQIDFECNDANRERYKAFVQEVLINNVWDEGNGAQKYIGNKNFSDMSKQIANDWKKVDLLADFSPSAAPSVLFAFASSGLGGAGDKLDAVCCFC